MNENSRISMMDEDSLDDPDKENTMSGNEDMTKNDDDIKDEDETDQDDDSESEESDSMDEEEADSRRSRYVSDMSDLEKQFADLKEQLYKDRITQIEEQLEEVNSSEAKEYTGPLKQLEQECIIRTEVAGHRKHYKGINLDNKLQCELQAAEQHFQNEERFLFSSLILAFEEKLRKIEEEKHSSEIYSDLWCEDSYRGRKKKKGMEMFVPDKRKKPVTVTGPYIVYMLNEMDILEDWAAIRKAKSELARRKAAELSIQEKDPLVTARYEDGKFFYQGEWFQKGEKVILDNLIDSPVLASITAINTGEVWVSKTDAVKFRLFISQFQKGKYLMKRSSNFIEDDEFI